MKNLSTEILPYRIFTIMVISFLIGIFISSQFLNINFYDVYYIPIISLILLFLILILFRQIKFIKILAIAVIILLMSFSYFSWRNSILKVADDSYIETNFETTIDSQPEINGQKQKFFVKNPEFSKHAKILVETARFPKYEYNDKIFVSGKIDKIENFNDFNYQNYLLKFSTTGIIKNAKIELRGKNSKNFLSVLYNIKTKFENTIINNLPEPESSLADGIILGSKKGFSDSLTNDFSNSGTTHIIALSGFNVTIIIVAVYFLFLGILPKRINFIFSSLVIIGFVLATGAASSIVRAAVISIMLLFGKSLGRRADQTNILLLAALLMVIVNPFILNFDVGFQLSFLAFAGLIYISPILSGLIKQKNTEEFKDKIKGILAETLAAQITVAPILIFAFGKISIISPLANLAILPLIPITMLIIFIAGLGSILNYQIGKIFFIISDPILKYILSAIHFFANLPISSISINSNYRIYIIWGLFILLVSGYLLLKKFADESQSKSIF